jgi:molybdopterin synthase catalytic subunit
MQLRVDLRSTNFEPLVALERWQEEQHMGDADSAAEALFIGRVRGVAADGSELEALEVEHYPGMTEQQLERLALDCCHRHGVNSCLVREWRADGSSEWLSGNTPL